MFALRQQGSKRLPSSVSQALSKSNSALVAQSWLFPPEPAHDTTPDAEQRLQVRAGLSASLGSASQYRSNNFNTGTGAITVSNSDDSGNGDAFQIASAGTAGTAVYDSTTAAHGAQSLLVTANASADAYSLGWGNTGGTDLNTSRVAVSFYFRIATWPTATTDWFRIMNGAGTSIARVYMTSAGRLAMLDAQTNTIYTLITPVPTSTWVRIEAVVEIGVDEGRFALAFFTGDSLTPTESYDTGHHWNMGSRLIDRVVWGKLSGTSTTWAINLDSFQVATNTSSFIGPWQRHETTAALSGTAALTTAGDVVPGGGGGTTHEATAALSATAASSAAGVVVDSGGAALAATAGLVSAGAVTRVGAVSMSATAGVVSAGVVVDSGGAALAATAALSSAAAVTRVGAVAMSATAGVVSAGDVVAGGGAALAGTAGLVAAGAVTRVGAVSRSATAALSAAGAVTRVGAASRSVTAGLVSAAAVTRAGGAALGATGTVVAGGSVTRVGSSALSGSAGLVADATVTGAAVTGSALLNGAGGGIVALASVATTGSASAAASSTLAAAGTRVVLGQVSAAASTTAAASASVSMLAAAALAGAGALLQPTGLVTRFGSVTLVGATTLAPPAGVVVPLGLFYVWDGSSYRAAKSVRVKDTTGTWQVASELWKKEPSGWAKIR